MITVLEGPIGSGKSTTGRLLSQRMNTPLYRPFRLHRDDHTPGIVEPRLVRIGLALPTNSWQEDMYVADVLAALRPSAILDRSMPSALAYERKLPVDDQQVVAGMWADRIVQANGCVLFFDAPEERRRKAAGTRFIESEQRNIEEVLDLMWTIHTGFREHLYRIDASTATAEDIAEAIHRGDAASHKMIRGWRA